MQLTFISPISETYDRWTWPYREADEGQLPRLRKAGSLFAPVAISHVMPRHWVDVDRKDEMLTKPFRFGELGRGPGLG